MQAGYPVWRKDRWERQALFEINEFVGKTDKNPPYSNHLRDLLKMRKEKSERRTSRKRSESLSIKLLCDLRNSGMDSLYTILFFSIFISTSALPCWAILSFPNYWIGKFPQVPAKRLTVLCVAISLAFAYSINFELDAGIITGIVYLVFSTSILAVLILIALVIKLTFAKESNL